MMWPPSGILPQALLGAGSILLLLVFMALLKRMGDAWHWAPELQRKLVHISVGLYAISLPWLFTDRWPVYAVLAFTLGVLSVLRLPHLAKGGIGETLHGVERQSYGDFLFVLAVAMVYVVADGRTVLYVLPLAILTLADAAAALAGTAYGRIRFQIEDGVKSLEGSIIFFLVAYILSANALLFLTDEPDLNVMILSLMVAVFAALVEAHSWRGFDNLFLPLGVLLFLSMNLDSDPWQLVQIMGLFLAALGGFWALAPWLGLPRSSARIYAMAVFLILSVTAVHNALWPILTLLAYARAKAAAPDQDRFPDLDIIAAVAVLSFGWLAVGLGLGYNAISFYTLTFLVMTILLIELAIHAESRGSRLIKTALMLALLMPAYFFTMQRNPVEETQWHGSLLLLVALSVAIAVLAGLNLPGWFTRARSLKVSLVAGLLPAGAYLLAVARLRGWI